jgi:protein gp37
MGRNTGIEWCEATFNPWRGCQKVSPGCEHCYAETLSRRNPKVLGEWGPGGTRVIASESAWREPPRWDRAARAAGVRRRVFCASLADVFEDRPELVAPRVRLFHLISETRHLDWLLLTKRPENVRRFRGGDGVPRSWPENMPPNVWLGVSAEDQRRADERIPLLLQTPAAVRFVSAEPLLGPVDLSAVRHQLGAESFATVNVLVEKDSLNRGHDRPRLDWVIVGGESGPGARPMRLEWARSLVTQCREAGVAVFCKQIGTVAAWDLGSRDAKGGRMEDWPVDLRVREFPAAASE